MIRKRKENQGKKEAGERGKRKTEAVLFPFSHYLADGRKKDKL